MFTLWPSWVLYLIAGLIGAILGSFANVCIYRLPRHKSVVSPPSHCPACGHRLAAWENIPLASFILLAGRCRKCKRPIPLIYPVVEALCIVLSVFTWWRYGEPAKFLVYYCLFIIPLVVITFIDIGHRIIPDTISLPGIGVGTVVHTIFENHGNYLWAATESLIGAAAGGALLFAVAFTYERLKKREGLGGGDVKFIAMLGAFFGWQGAIFILFISSVLGSLAGIVLILAMHKGTKYPIPYGPFLALAGLLQLFFGQRLIDWYIGLL